MNDNITTKDLIIYIETKMKEGKKSPVHGWSMNDILWDIYTQWGRPAYDFSRKYIIENYR
jgi:hypothetical protein